MSAKEDPEHWLQVILVAAYREQAAHFPSLCFPPETEPMPTITLTPAKHPCKDFHFPVPQFPHL